jgi:uncharacterized protein DUF5916
MSGWSMIVRTVLIASLAIRCRAAAQATPEPVAGTARPVLRVALISERVTLDGRLTEPAWSTDDSITDLTQSEPREGRTPTGRTVVRVLTTGTEILIGVRADDPEPSRIVSFARERDAVLDDEDHIKIVLDTYHDGRSGYVFAVNPNGARYDALVAEQGEAENANWDAIWEAATARTSTGWSAEIAIPLKSLLFRPDLTEWGFNVERRIQRLQETDRWASPARDYHVTQTGRAGVLAGLPRFVLGLGLSVRPSLTGGGARDSAGASIRNRSHAALDATQRLGANTLGSLTVNTDFAETEVDARRVNLTRFPLFFPEKRTFFLEGADIFDFGLGLGTSSGEDSDLLPFFSRRIGLLRGNEVPLRVGGKLIGRTGGTSFGALLARTGELEGFRSANTLGVIRLRQNVLRESSVGIIGTVGDPEGFGHAWVAGSDLTYQTSRFHGDKNFLVGVWALGMDRDSLGGTRYAWGGKIDYPNDRWDLSLNYKRLDPDFQPSLGFVPRPDVQILDLTIVFSPRPGGPIRTPLGPLHVRQMFHEVFPHLVTDLSGRWQSYELFMTPVNWRLESGDRFEFNIVPAGERLANPFEIADGVTLPAGSYRFLHYRLEGELAAKRRMSGLATWWFGPFYDGHLHQIELTAAWRLSPLVIMELTGERDVGRMPEGDFTQTLAGTRLRLNFSPDLQLTSFVQYDTESDLVGTNTRLRWTFDPLGELFVVYDHNLRTRDPLTNRRQIAFASNQLLVKVQYAFRY